MNTLNDSISGRGSLWHRWEPHIHAPGTVLNDQFDAGEQGWNSYLEKLETASPAIHALGITDYYGTDGYESVRAAKAAGRLPNCELIFANVELRLDIGTIKGAWVNIHLLVSPEDPNHMQELKRFLGRLQFRAFDDSFCCSREDLIALGKRSRPAIRDDNAALAQGCLQFKVSLENLRSTYTGSAWAAQNILVAVAGNSSDGASGVRDGADATLREEIEKFAHIIFSGNPKDREFWLGFGALSADRVRQRYDRLKPCLHGSDAHSHAVIGAPDSDRYCWLKGGLSFDTLRQACIDPEGRAYVGEKPPTGAMPSQVIDEVEILNASWITTPRLQLNPALVAIIGPRGSGKTALADILAAGCDAALERINKQSFLVRAQEHLTGSSVKLTWEGSNEPTFCALDKVAPSLFEAGYPRARYLSQQFVEELCSSDGMTDALLQEIERVVFEAHDVSDRDGAIDFRELVNLKAGRYRQAREREEEALEAVSDRIGAEFEKDRQVPLLKSHITEKTRLIAQYTTDRGKLVAKGSEQRLVRVEVVTKAAEKVRGYIRFYSNQEQALLAMKDEVADVRQNQAPEVLRRMKERHVASHIEDQDWTAFLLKYSGDVDTLIVAGLQHAKERMQHWKGTAPAPRDDLAVSFVGESAELDRTAFAILEAEITRLQKLIGGDREMAAKFAAASKRITEETAALERLKEKLADCEQAKQRIGELNVVRQDGYVRVFEAVLAEQEVLTNLYAPLMARVSGAAGALGKLLFTVKRVVDLELWARRGEELLDLRRQGPVRGRGTLAQRAERLLKEAWEQGDAQAVATAMTEFRTEITEQELSQIARGDPADYRAWLRRLARWLYSTDHIAIHYSVDYDGVDIRKLSPGTRGIVLLLLYLALDEADDRPLIIDQPEENLDPKSIYNELVGLFLEAKRKRQVIIATHNANLVVNTDADQIIIASVSHNSAGQLPLITYTSGGFECEQIRKCVCDILEGGEIAFKERARRLRVGLERH
jgi:energy-coupling factor transporter ATP-binding protein EcfA2